MAPWSPAIVTIPTARRAGGTCRLADPIRLPEDPESLPSNRIPHELDRPEAPLDIIVPLGGRAVSVPDVLRAMSIATYYLDTLSPDFSSLWYPP